MKEEILSNRYPFSYGYNLTHLIREHLMWQLNLPFAKAQEIAEKISDQAYYANWLEVTLPDGQWHIFETKYFGGKEK